jgi:hypothetical protein
LSSIAKTKPWGLDAFRAKTPMHETQKFRYEVRSYDFCTKPKDNLLVHLDFELDVPYMFFDHIDERNVMVKSISHFDNFSKWTIVVVNNSEPN